MGVASGAGAEQDHAVYAIAVEGGSADRKRAKTGSWVSVVGTWMRLSAGRYRTVSMGRRRETRQGVRSVGLGAEAGTSPAGIPALARWVTAPLGRVLEVVSDAAVWRRNWVVRHPRAKLDTRIETYRSALRIDVWRANSDVFETYPDVMMVWLHRRCYRAGRFPSRACARKRRYATLTPPHERASIMHPFFQGERVTMGFCADIASADQHRGRTGES